VMRDRTVMRVFLIVLVATAFGVAMSVLKGNGAGIRDDVGNLSAPWLLLPFFAGAAMRGRGLAGAAIGLAATCAGLVAFYVANAFVLNLGPHSLLVDLQLTISATGYWFPRGLVSGPVFGALGALWRRRGYSTLGAVTAILLLDAEPLFWMAAHHTDGVGSFNFEPALVVSVGEALVGLAACMCVAVILSRTPRRATLPPSE
jgi:hypothetical protein